MKFNAVSQDNPFKSIYSNISPFKSKPEKSKLLSEMKNGFNNESPELFKLNSMKENQKFYHNPHLEEVIKEDRNLFFKNIYKTKDQINLIDKLKMTREVSQNPMYLKYITNSQDMKIIDKRNRLKNDKEKECKMSKSNSMINIYKLNKEIDQDLYHKKLRQLHYEYSPKHSNIMMRKLDLNNSDTLEKSEIPLKMNFDYKKSAYLKNMNDYDIKDSGSFNEESFLNFNKKSQVDFNCVIDQKKTIFPDKFRTPKWSSFYENYLLLVDKEKGFKKKGGLFTEFLNKNKNYIDMKKAQMKVISDQKNNIKRNSETNSNTNTYVSFPKKDNNSLDANSILNNRKIKKETLSPNLDKVKEVIEDKRLYKLKHYLVKTGAITNSNYK